MAHFHIVNRHTGGVINRIRFADSERASDNLEIKNEKRRKEAERLMSRWRDQDIMRNAELSIEEIPTSD